MWCEQRFRFLASSNLNDSSVLAVNKSSTESAIVRTQQSVLNSRRLKLQTSPARRYVIRSVYERIKLQLDPFETLQLLAIRIKDKDDGATSL